MAIIEDNGSAYMTLCKCEHQVWNDSVVRGCQSIFEANIAEHGMAKHGAYAMLAEQYSNIAVYSNIAI